MSMFTEINQIIQVLPGHCEFVISVDTGRQHHS